MKKAQSHTTATEPSSGLNTTTLKDQIKVKLQLGKSVLVVDYPPEQRQEVIGMLAALKDELPIVMGWQTLRQSHVNETKTRAKSYYIPEVFLRVGGAI